jgi:hypothetical protein
MDQIRGVVAGLSGADRLDVLVSEFVRISGLKRAAAGNYTYNGALHGLYAAVQNILNTPISGSTGFVGFGKITEPQNAKYWNDVNSYESWLYAELTAFAAGRPAAKPTAPLGKPEDQFDHEAFMGLLMEAKDQAKARLSGVALKTAPVGGPLGLAPVASGVGLPVATAPTKPLSLAIAVSVKDDVQKQALLAKLNAELAATPYDEPTLLQKWTGLPPGNKTALVANLLNSTSSAKDFFELLATAPAPVAAPVPKVAAPTAPTAPTAPKPTVAAMAAAAAEKMRLVDEIVKTADEAQKPALRAKLNAELAAKPYDAPALLGKWNKLPPANKTEGITILLNPASTAMDFFNSLMRLKGGARKTRRPQRKNQTRRK